MSAPILSATLSLLMAQVAVTADGSADRGAQLAASCAACHGQHGEGLAASGFPRLAGQPAVYLVKQLHDFANGSRVSAVMSPFAQTLSEQAMVDIGTYYENLSAPPTAPQPAAAGSTQGATLANIGSAKLGVPACANCHGPNGRGEPPAVPYLAGQHANYIAAQIEAWRKGTRHNDGGDQMAGVARSLSVEEIEAVAAHFARQAPPTP